MLFLHDCFGSLHKLVHRRVCNMQKYQWRSQRGAGGNCPLAEILPPLAPQMKLHFVQRSTESRHFESQSAAPPRSPLSPPPLPPPHFEKSGYAPEKYWSASVEKSNLWNMKSRLVPSSDGKLPVKLNKLPVNLERHGVEIRMHYTKKKKKKRRKRKDVDAMKQTSVEETRWLVLYR